MIRIIQGIIKIRKELEKINEKMKMRKAKILDASQKTIKRDISKLKEKGIIERKGGRKKGYWEIIKNSNKDKQE